MGEIMKKIKSLCFVALCLYMTACQKNNDKSQVFNSEASNQNLQQEITQASEFTEETEPLIADAPEALSQEVLDADYPLGFSQELIKAFEESDDNWVSDSYGPVVKQWITEISQNNSIDLLLTYCKECEKRTYFERSFNTMPNPLICVIEADWKEGFDTLLEQYYDLVNLKYETEKHSETTEFPLQAAVKSGNLYYVTRLLEMSADVNVDIQESLYSPLKNNLLSFCNNEEIETLLISKGIETSFETNMKMTKCSPEKANSVKLYESPDENAPFIEYEFSDEDCFTVTEVSYKKGEKVKTKEISGYVQLDRWTKVTVNGESGWVKPGEMFLAFGYYQP